MAGYCYNYTERCRPTVLYDVTSSSTSTAFHSIVTRPWSRTHSLVTMHSRTGIARFSNISRSDRALRHYFARLLLFIRSVYGPKRTRYRTESIVMSQEGSKTSSVVLIGVDNSENCEHAFDCEYTLMARDVVLFVVEEIPIWTPSLQIMRNISINRKMKWFYFTCLTKYRFRPISLVWFRICDLRKNNFVSLSERRINSRGKASVNLFAWTC